MPVFEIQNESGTFQVEAPDQNTALSALSSLPSGPENSMTGSAKALASGTAEGVAGLVGMPGDIAELGARGIDRATQFVGNKLGIPVNKREDRAPTYGMDSAKKAIESVTGELYQPQTTTEKYLHTIGSFAPAVIGGPEGIATRLVTRAVIPGVASEAAGQLAEGTGYEPIARIAGGLAGSVAGGRLAQSLNAPKVAAAPAREDIASAVSGGYNSPAVKALEIKPAYADTVANNITANLGKLRFSERDPGTATVYGLVNDLRKPEFGANHTLADFDNVRRRLSEVAGAGGQAGTAAQKAIRSIDAATLRIPTSMVAAGDAKAASRALFEARQNAAAGFRSDKVTQVLERAANTATATHSGGNIENEIYKQVRTMLNDPRKHLRGWKPEEIEALRAVLPGVGANALRRAGKIMGGGGGLGQLASGSAGAAMFGPAGMIALPALGMGANRLGAAFAERRLGAVDELLRSRTPLYGPTNQAASQAALQRGGLLAGLPPAEAMALQALIAGRSGLQQTGN